MDRPVARPWLLERSRRVATVAGAGVAVLLASQTLAGYGFLMQVFGDGRAARPWTVAQYARWYGDRADVRRRLVAWSAAGGVLVGGLFAAPWLPRRRSLHGDARFATRAEIARAGLFATRGLVLGRFGRRYLVLGGQQGVALAAPPRAGKGVGVVIPNALSWSGSLVCVDIKRENWTVTAGYRAACGQACHLFDPFAEDGRTARWNPFHYVADDPVRRVNDLQRIADMLYPEQPGTDPFWIASARSLFLGIALYLFETPSLPKTVGEVLRQGMASDDEGFGQHWKRLIQGRMSGNYPLSAECVRALYDVIDLAPVTASSIRKTFTSRLDLWLNPILDAATSGNDFDLRELRRQPISIYVGVNPEDLHRLRPVLNLFFQQAIGLQTRVLPEHDPTLKHQVLMLLDEFTALGRIPIMAEAISYLPGYDVRVMLVIQTPAQLREVYGPHASETMLKSLAARIAFAPKDVADAREISDELGFATVKVRSTSTPVPDPFAAKGSRGRSHTESLQKRALLLPQEVKELSTREAIVFYEGLRPVKCRKVRWFEDPTFRVRLRPPPERSASALERHAAETHSREAHATPELLGEPPTLRTATVEDVARLDDLTLEDLAIDTDAIEVPPAGPDGRLSPEAMVALAEAFAAATPR
jgi:type IV secretion system protein VirD4